MPLSTYKIKELETFAHKLNTEPDKLLDALISFVFSEPKQKEIVKEVKKLTPEEKVKAIEEQALSKGWTHEQLWKRPKLNIYPEMGLICFIDSNTVIGNVTDKHISLIHHKPVGEPVILNFYNKNVEQPWIIKGENT
jgi:hypothetical protein